MSMMTNNFVVHGNTDYLNGFDKYDDGHNDDDGGFV